MRFVRDLGESVDPRVQWVVDLLKAHPVGNFRVSELAHAVNLSRWHFSRLFLEETRMSLHQFIRQLRLARAKVLLESSFLGIKEVMAAVGINDKSHFAKDFKKLYGLSPIQYRHRHTARQITKSKLGQQIAKLANT